MKILKDSSIYLFGEMLSKLMPFLLFPYLTRKLGVSGFGELSYYQTIIALLVIFIGMSQDGAITRYFYRYGKKSLSLVVLSGLFYSITIAVLCLVIAIIFHNELIIYVIITALFQSLFASQLAIRQCQKQALRYTVLQLFSSVLSISITILLFELYISDTFTRIISMAIANAIAFGCGFYFFYRDGVKLTYKIKDFKKAFNYILMFGVPLIFHNMSFFIKGQLDRVIIAEKFSYNDLGIYSAAAQLAMIFMVVLQALNKATVPYFYQALKDNVLNKKLVLKYSAYSLLIVPIPGLAALLIPNEVYLFLLGQQFDGIKWYTILFLFGYVLNIPYLILVNYLFFHAKNKQIAFFTALSSIAYLGILFVLIQLGLIWVPLATFFSNIILIILLLVFVGKYQI